MKEQELVTIPWNCPACRTCRLIVRGTYGCAGPRSCVNGGPFSGYDADEELRSTIPRGEDA